MGIRSYRDTAWCFPFPCCDPQHPLASTIHVAPIACRPVWQHGLTTCAVFHLWPGLTLCSKYTGIWYKTLLT